MFLKINTKQEIEFEGTLERSQDNVSWEVLDPQPQSPYSPTNSNYYYRVQCENDSSSGSCNGLLLGQTTTEKRRYLQIPTEVNNATSWLLEVTIELRENGGRGYWELIRSGAFNENRVLLRPSGNHYVGIKKANGEVESMRFTHPISLNEKHIFKLEGGTNNVSFFIDGIKVSEVDGQFVSPIWKQMGRHNNYGDEMVLYDLLIKYDGQTSTNLSVSSSGELINEGSTEAYHQGDGDPEFVLSTSCNVFPSNRINVILHGGQSNSISEGDVTNFPELAEEDSLVSRQDFIFNGSLYEEDTFFIGGRQELYSSSQDHAKTVSASTWYSKAMQESNPNTHCVYRYGKGGTPTSKFYPYLPWGQGLGVVMDKGLSKTFEELEVIHPDKEPLLQCVYWDQVEFDGGNGSGQNISKSEFETIRDTRARTIRRLYDALTGSLESNVYSDGYFNKANPDVVLFVRDIGDGQHRVGGGGVAPSANLSDPDYIIKADPSNTFNGTSVPYQDEGGSLYDESAEWNRWMAIRSAHQLLTDPAHNSTYYSPNIVLIDADGIGTRGSGPLSGDGVHFGASNQKLLAERFLLKYNERFGTSITI